MKDLLTSKKTPVSFVSTLVSVFTKVEKNADNEFMDPCSGDSGLWRMKELFLTRDRSSSFNGGDGS